MGVMKREFMEVLTFDRSLDAGRQARKQVVDTGGMVGQ